MNPPDSDYGVVSDPVWDQFGVALLPKKNARTKFKLLRPMAILLANAKLWSRCFFLILGDYDVDCSASHLGFRKEHYRAEVFTVVRIPLSKRWEWGLRTCWVQIDFAPAYALVRHKARLVAMERRGVPQPLAFAYFGEARRARMVFTHAGWFTDPIRAGVG